MADSADKTRDPTSEAPREGIRLTKEERKALMAEIERELSRTETPQRILQRAEQALADGQLDQARRLAEHLGSIAPHMAGLVVLRDRMREVEREERRKTNLRQAEEMLRRYIQQRKKPLAEMALETLLEIAPQHPQRQEYETWVADLDQEVALQRRLDEELAAGRAALRADDPAAARRHLEMLRKLDPEGPATDTLAGEIAAAEQDRAESADIERLKHRVEELIASRRFDDAGNEVQRLAAMDVPKLTVDFFRKRLAEAQHQAREQAEAEALTAIFRRHLENRDWQSARDVAHRFGERFPDRPEASRFFNQVIEMEAAERRQQSLEQGIETLEKFLAEGKRREAEVAVKLLRQLQLDETQVARFAARVAKM